MPCKQTGCNYPEGECNGACQALTIQYAGSEPKNSPQLYVGVACVLLVCFALIGVYKFAQTVAGWLA
jgi:hypothetical protein